MTLPHAQTWAALLLAVLMSLLLLACAAADQQNADIARLEERIATLEANQAAGDSGPGPVRSPAIAPTTTPWPTATATPDTGDICYRTPEVQQAILDTLELRACQVVTTPELFRIRSLTQYQSTSPATINAPAFKPGDFAGLTNLERLEINAQEVPEPAAFDGLTGLKSLTLRVNNPGQPTDLPPAMFAAMPQLAGLSLDGYFRVASDTLDGLPALEGLSISSATTYTPHALDNLPLLKSLTWGVAKLTGQQSYQTPVPAEGRIPRNWLAGLPELTDFNLDARHLPSDFELGSLKAAAGFFEVSGWSYQPEEGWDSLSVSVEGEKVEYEYRDSFENINGDYVTGSLLVVGDRTIRIWQLLDE